VSKKKALTYREQQEWEQMEQKIVQAEDAVAACQAAMGDPAVVCDAAALQARCEALDAAHVHVEKLYARWTQLEEKRGQSMKTS
jgi:ATP-binding cassette subfamily F protein uup